MWPGPSPRARSIRQKNREDPGGGGWRQKLGSHQVNSIDFRDVRVFTLEKGDRKLFAVLAEVKEDGEIFRRLIGGVRDILAKYDLHRGWFGTGTLLHSVTRHPGHPLGVIAAGLGQGNDWFTFSGYMDYLLQAQLAEWLGKGGPVC